MPSLRSLAIQPEVSSSSSSWSIHEVQKCGCLTSGEALSEMLIDRLLMQKSQTHTSASCSSVPDVTASREPPGWTLAWLWATWSQDAALLCLLCSQSTWWRPAKEAFCHSERAVRGRRFQQSNLRRSWERGEERLESWASQEPVAGGRGESGLTGPWGWATLHLAAGWNPGPLQNLPQRFLMKYELVSSPRMHVWAMSTSGFALFKNVHDTFSLRNLSFSVLPPCWLQLWLLRQEFQVHCVTSTDSLLLSMRSLDTSLCMGLSQKKTAETLALTKYC